MIRRIAAVLCFVPLAALSEQAPAGQARWEPQGPGEQAQPQGPVGEQAQPQGPPGEQAQPERPLPGEQAQPERPLPDRTPVPPPRGWPSC